MEYRVLYYCVLALRVVGAMFLAGAIVLTFIAVTHMGPLAETLLQQPWPSIMLLVQSFGAVLIPAVSGLLFITGAEVVELLIRLEQNTRRS